MKPTIQVISAPSILGLKPGGVEHLGGSLLGSGLLDSLKTTNPVIHVAAPNSKYSFERDATTNCLNAPLIKNFSIQLGEEIFRQAGLATFPLVLGGDCSILLGIMPALKRKGAYGLVFLDAHADFYEPSKSITGEVADMDLAIVTGRGPDSLTNIQGLKPYVEDANVIHVGQRDADETKEYGSQDIKDTAINCFDLETITSNGLNRTANNILELMQRKRLDGFWLHFDTDVLNDDENPAVDYRLPGGLALHDAELLLKKLLSSGQIVGMSVTIFNPTMDANGMIAREIATCIANALG